MSQTHDPAKPPLHPTFRVVETYSGMLTRSSWRVVEIKYGEAIEISRHSTQGEAEAARFFLENADHNVEGNSNRLP